MGGFFGAVGKKDCMMDVFFGLDYHSHLGTRFGGMVAYDPEKGFERQIHSISNTQFRTKFDKDVSSMRGRSVIGCISDTDPQPLMVRSHLGLYALTTVGIIKNEEELVKTCLKNFTDQFMATSTGKVNSTELVAALINQKEDFVSGIKYAQEVIEGSLTLLILTENGDIIAARDKVGRLPVQLGKNEDGCCVSFESFAFQKLGYERLHELGPGEIVRMNAEGYEIIAAPGDKLRICTFLWTYYGYPASSYEGINVEINRYNNGRIMARDERARGTMPELDFVAGVPDSGVAHAIGYSHESGYNFARPFVKYTPTWARSFMPTNQNVRNQVARMKQLPIPELIKGKKLLFVDDSIVRGTQLGEMVDYLYGAGAKEVHMRSACPPIVYGCKYLNFSASKGEDELIARRVVKELEGDEALNHLEEYSDAGTERGKCMTQCICKKLGFDSLAYQSLKGVVESVGIGKENLCTYCWDGKE